MKFKFRRRGNHIITKNDFKMEREMIIQKNNSFSVLPMFIITINKYYRHLNFGWLFWYVSIEWHELPQCLMSENNN